MEAALNIGVGEHGEPPAVKVISDIREKRGAYDEARTGFEALVGAIETGYIDSSEFADGKIAPISGSRPGGPLRSICRLSNPF